MESTNDVFDTLEDAYAHIKVLRSRLIYIDDLCLQTRKMSESEVREVIQKIHDEITEEFR